MTPAAAPRLHLKSALKILIAAAFLVAVVAISGRPSVNPDSFSYFRRGVAVADVVAKPLSRLIHHGQPSAPPAASPTQASSSPGEAPMGARSPYYGIFLYVCRALGSLWVMAWIDAIAVAWVIHLLLKKIGTVERYYLPIMVVLAAVTAAPFYVGFATPDIFAPLGVLASVNILLFWARLSLAERVGLAVLVAASLCFHTSHVLLEACLIGVAIPLLWWFRVPSAQMLARLSILLLAIVIAAGAEAGYDAFIHKQTGSAPFRPPFLVARMLGDGPGRAYLHQACAKGSPYVLCQFNSDPLDDAQNILWGDHTHGGIVKDSTPAVRTALAKQEGKFAIGVVTHYPVWEAEVSLKNWFDQLTLVDVVEPLADPVALDTSIRPPVDEIEALVPNGAGCVAKPGSCGSRFSEFGLALVDRTAVALAIGLITGYLVYVKAWRLARSRPSGGFATTNAVEVSVILILIFAIVANAAITGVISGPFPRYGARMVWLIPLAAMLGAAACRTASKRLTLPTLHADGMEGAD